MNNRNERDRDTFKLNFYFQGLQLFCGDEHFVEQVEMAMLPGQGSFRNLRNHFGKCVPAFSWYVQLMLL